MDNNLSQANGVAPEDEVNLRAIWNLLVRNRLIIGGCIALVVAAAVVYTYLSAPVYEASASIRIDEDKSALGIFGTFDMLAASSEVSTEMEVLRSRTVAETVVEQLGLQLALRSPGRVPRNTIFVSVRVDRSAPNAEYRARATSDGRFTVENVTTGTSLGTFSPGETIALDGGSVVLSQRALQWGEIAFEIVTFSDAVQALRKAISVIRPNREANVVIVRYESHDDILVYQVPNAIARTFIDARQEVRKTEARSTVEFLRGQINLITEQLGAAEEALRAFRENEQVVSLEAQATTQVTRLADLQAERNALETERAALAALLDEVESAAAGASPATPSPYRRLVAFPSLFRNQASSELLRSLTALENERAQLLNRRTAAHPDVEVLSDRIRELEQQLRTIATTYLQGITSQVASLDAILGRYGEQLERIPAKEVQFARLQRQAKVLEEIYVLLQTRLKEAEIAQAVEDPSVRLIDPAVHPVEPIKPRLMLNLLLALVLGTMLGTGAAFARNFMDTTIHTREEVQEITGVPVLGNIPRIRETGPGMNGRRKASDAPTVPVNGNRAAGFEMRLVTGRDPRNPVSEAYRALRTNITFARPDEPPKAIVFTSPTPGDGKSTSAANLAVTLAQQGHKVLLVDADMRRGVLNNVFGEDREPGLSNVLLGTTDVARAIRSVDLGESGTLDFLPTGTLPPNPAELLGSTRMRDLLGRLEETYDTIILDAPPLNLVTDAAVLGTNADGVLIVARAATTQKGALHYAIEQLRNVRAPVLGAVLNDIDYKRDMRYGGKYGSYGMYSYEYYGMDKD